MSGMERVLGSGAGGHQMASANRLISLNLTFLVYEIGWSTGPRGFGGPSEAGAGTCWMSTQGRSRRAQWQLQGELAGSL